MGAELSLSHDSNGERLQSDIRYTYDVSEKGLNESSRGELTADHIKFLRLVNAKSLAVLAQIGGIEVILPECWHVARQHASI
jgi:hypothetical protein